MLRQLRRRQIAASRTKITEKLIDLIDRIAVSEVELWPFKDLFSNSDAVNKLAADETAEFDAIFAQAVAPQLAGMTSGAVLRRHSRGESPD